MNKIQLSDHFTYRRLLRFTFPSVVMMVFTSIYGVVDGIFVSNFAGKTPFAAINLIMPYLMILGTIGFMIGSGGTALISMTMGAGDKKKANEIFSLLTYACLISGGVLAILGLLFLNQAAVLLGAEGQMLADCVRYGRIILLALPFFIVQNAFQSFCIAAEKPNLGLGITVAAGLTNIVLDALFVGLFRWGITGAAIATAFSQTVGAAISLIYFVRPNTSLLRLGKTRFDGHALLRTCVNGSSELMSNLSMSLVSMLFNFQLMRFAGEDGVAAYGVIMYVNFIFLAIFFGYSIGSAPIIGFHYGADNQDELKNLLRRSLILISIFAVTMTASAILLARPLSAIFVSYDADLMSMTVRAFLIYSLSFLVCGFNIFGSSFFTALNNGLISAAISFFRTLVFQSVTVLILPEFLGLDGIWWSIVAGEVGALVLTVICLILNKKRYHYA